MEKKVNKSRRYCFTIPNYTKKDLERFHKLAEALEKHNYICYGLEIAPETGMKHIQGYVELKEGQRLKYLQSYFDFKKGKKRLQFHIDIANGTAEENKKYCSKGGDFYEFGEPTTQGSRTDLKIIKEAVKENPKDITHIVDEYVSNHQQLRYAEGLRQYYYKERDPNIPPEVYWVYGATGVGKTSLVFRCFEDVCSVSSYDWIGTGYTQNECLLFDDIREFDLPFAHLLKITDRFKLMLFYKGGQIPLNSPFIVFTSPKSIDETFNTKAEDLRQLKRRVKQIDLDLNNPDKIDLKNLDEKFIDKDNDEYNRL